MGILLNSCLSKPKPIALSLGDTCQTSDDASGNTSTLTIGASEKISQRFWVQGFAGAGIYVSEIIVNMDTSNLTSIKLTLYEDKTNDQNLTPDQGTELGSTTVTSGLWSSDTKTEISFKLSSDALLSVGKTYYLVLEPSGGSFIIPYVRPYKVAGSQIRKYNGTSWDPILATTYNLSFKMNYSQCTGL